MIRVLIILFSFIIVSWFTFATSETQAVSTWVYGFLNILNLIWLPLAILAGKLFTNDLVYGTFMHMDIILRKIWNFSKSVSLIILWFVLIYLIFGLFVWKTKNIGDNLLKIAFAGVLIPASWFLIGVLVDLSTLLLVAVWSFPMRIVSNSDISTANVRYCNNIYLKPTLRFTQFKDMLECKSEGWNINDFISKMNNLAGPLLYIGQSILYLDRDWWIIDKEHLEQKKQNPLKVVSLAIFLKLIVLWLFVTPIFVLVLIGLIRIFWLWIYIWFSPFIILDHIFWWKFLWKKNYFKFSNMIWLIFQPVFVVFAMWISLVFLSTLRNIMVVDYTSWNTNPGLVQLWVCKNNPNSFCIWDVSVFTVWWNLMKKFLDNTWWFFGYLIFVLLVSKILFSMLKVASKSSSITSSIVDDVYVFTKESFMTIPIIPTSKWWVGLWAMNIALKRKGVLTKWLGSKAWERADELVKTIYRKVWVEYSDLGVSELLKREKEIKEIKDSRTLISSFGGFIWDTIKNHQNMIIANSSNFKKAVYEFLNQALVVDNTAKNVFKTMDILDKKNRQLLPLNEVFSNEKFLIFLYNIFNSSYSLSFSDIPDFNTLYHNLSTSGDTKFIYEKLWKAFKNSD